MPAPIAAVSLLALAWWAECFVVFFWLVFFLCTVAGALSACAGAAVVSAVALGVLYVPWARALPPARAVAMSRMGSFMMCFLFHERFLHQRPARVRKASAATDAPRQP